MKKKKRKSDIMKRNHVAKALASPLFRRKVVKSKKVYSRKKVKR